jgi:hypothetical protein
MIREDLSEAKTDSDPAWVELFPAGISFGTGVGRPVLILKDQNNIDVLPVWMHPIDAAVGLSELSTGSGTTPHAVTRKVFEAIGLKVESCTFVELIGHHQFVLLRFKGSKKLTALRVRADEAMSFCLQGKVRFFSTKEFMARCRDMDQDLSVLEETMGRGGHTSGQFVDPETDSKKHPYVM